MFKSREKKRLLLASVFLLFSSIFYVIIAKQAGGGYCRDCGSSMGCLNESTIPNIKEGWRECHWNQATQRCDMDHWGPCSEDPHLC